ncbi:MAG TPA: FliM/FliN family flagellar motor switch protein [Polyangiaceae bacterium]|nr:FliM/FliN family flagellar motor switch protein [Polyangiaceae bacterium]
MAQSNALEEDRVEPAQAPADSQTLKRLDLTGRERRLRSAMQAVARVAQNFARGARRSMPFLVKRKSRLTPASVAFVDLAPDALMVDGPSFEVLLEEPDGPGRACLFLNTDALAVVLEGALGGAGDAASGALGPALTVAQTALVSKVVRQLGEDLVRAVRDEVGLTLKVTLAHAIAAGEEREAAFSDGLGVDCGVEGLSPSARISLSMAAEALEVALKERDSEEVELGDPRIAEALHDVSVEVVAELGRVSIGLKRLLTLQPGQVLRLMTAVEDPAKIRVAGVTKFVGSPVVSRGQLAIQIKARHED